ncbi:hypothetical protein [Lignipirellula cremea]|uniref:hypothetical protein n=1 Tax=Lignipirellula cremea TaxID=2528010 RepID=UPI00119E9B9E|nr:hypothetical protein [Lignipirellula cremea]
MQSGICFQAGREAGQRSSALPGAAQLVCLAQEYLAVELGLFPGSCRTESVRWLAAFFLLALGAVHSRLECNAYYLELL